LYANIHIATIFEKKNAPQTSKNEINSAFLASRKGFEPPTPALGVPPEGSLWS
jgi:hypothetical protein